MSKKKMGILAAVAIVIVVIAAMLICVLCGSKEPQNGENQSTEAVAGIKEQEDTNEQTEESVSDVGVNEETDATETTDEIPTDVVLEPVEINTEMRREVSNEQPMWLIHIDSWNYADPQKIIDLIPEDIRPYVVFNISLSINWDNDAKKWRIVHDGYETAKSWLRTCADNQVWAMIQPASGGQCHFPDYDETVDYEDTLYAEFFREYPNFLGFNYCEQFWGFEQADFPVTPTERYEHFAKLLELSNKYGGYLVVSWCGNQWSPAINPLAMIKRVPNFEQACRTYTENFILEEKYTQTSYIADMESIVYGAYVSGYCGNFGVRYDESGWTDSTWTGTGDITKEEYRQSTGLPIHLERMVLNGATVIDGPELIWVDDFREQPAKEGADGYTSRSWAMCDQFQNNMIDLFRKVLDGSIRIPDREEVIARTKVILINDVTDGNDDQKYSTPAKLFEGLYRMSDDGNLRNNHDLYKSTGRYPTIPMAYALADDAALGFERVVYKTDMMKVNGLWAKTADKIAEFNEMFPEEYQGTCYVGRNENTWVTYNPFKNGTISTATVPFKYNTCEKFELEYSGYTSGIIREYADYLDIYLTNFDERNPVLKTNIIKIYGCTNEPLYTWKDRGYNQKESVLESTWEDGVFTLTVMHNGPLDIMITCEGAATDRLAEYTKAVIVEPKKPAFYTGERQYEAELFDYKNIVENVTNGCWSDVEGFQAQGFMKFGTKANAAVRDTVNTAKSGLFAFKLRYTCEAANQAIDLYVNGAKITTLSLEATDTMSSWTVCDCQIPLQAGENSIELIASEELPGNLYLDNFMVSGDFGEGLVR